MGNIIATIKWKKTRHDIEILPKIDVLVQKYDLDKHYNHLYHNERDDHIRNYYSVELSGMSFWWMGSTKAEQNIKAFLYDVSELIKKYKLSIKSDIKSIDNYYGTY